MLQINEKELLAADLGVRRLCSLSDVVELTVDNSVSFYYIKKQGGRKSHLNDLLRPLLLFCWSQGINIVPKWVPSEDNPADIISRQGVDHKAFCLHPTLFPNLRCALGVRPQVDVRHRAGHAVSSLYQLSAVPEQIDQPRLALSVRDAPVEINRPVASPPVDAPQVDVHVCGPVLDGGALGPPTNASLRAAFPAAPHAPSGGDVFELLRKANEETANTIPLRDALWEVLQRQKYVPAAITAFFDSIAKSLKRCNNAFKRIFALAGVAGVDFEDTPIPQVVSLLSILNSASESQARNAYSAPCLFPHLYTLKFDPTARTMRKKWAATAPRYASFFSVHDWLSNLRATSLDWKNKKQLRACLCVIWRLFMLYRSCDLFEVRRWWAYDEGKYFLAAKRKTWKTLRWQEVPYLGDTPELSPYHLALHYMLLTPEGNWCEDKGKLGHLFVGVVAPFKAISATRIGAITATEMRLAGIPADFGPHATRGAGLQFLKSLGLSTDHACDVGSWANYSAFKVHYERLGAVLSLSFLLQEAFVHTPSEAACCQAGSPPIPTSK